MPVHVQFFKYVRHTDVEIHERKGWAFHADLGPVHGSYSVLMVWAGEGDPS